MFAKKTEFIGWVELREMPYDRVTEGIGAHATGYARAFIEDDERLAIVPTFEDDVSPYPEKGEEITEEDDVLTWWFGEEPDTEDDFV